MNIKLFVLIILLNYLNYYKGMLEGNVKSMQCF